MRIGLFGNTCNNLYQLGKVLRATTSHDVHLYLDTRGDPQQRPESDDPELAETGYPAWIHVGTYLTNQTAVLPWRSSLVTELARCDFVIVSHLGPTYAQFAHRPTAFLVSGGDLTMHPFPHRWPALMPSITLPRRAALAVRGFWQKRGIRRCTEIWSQPFTPFVNALKELGIPDDRISPTYFPVLIDTDRLRFDPQAHTSEMPAVREITSRFSFTVFHPSRLMINDHPDLRATGQWKRNDLLIRGFARFLQRSGARDAGLVIVDRAASADRVVAGDLVRALGIEEQVVWLRPPRPFGFTRDELVTVYSVCDVVTDDFGVGWFGSIVLEGMAISKPVISYVDESVLQQIYPWHPILSPNSVEGIADLIMKLYVDRSFRDAQGQLGRRWVEEFHSSANAAAIFADRFSDLIERVGQHQPSNA